MRNTLTIVRELIAMRVRVGDPLCDAEIVPELWPSVRSLLTAGEIERKSGANGNELYYPKVLDGNKMQGQGEQNAANNRPE